MKQAEETNSQIGLEEQNYLLKTWKDLKDSIFNVLFVMLDKDDNDEQESILSIAFESGLDYLQMLAFPFDASIISVWNGGQTLDRVFQFFSKFNISTYLPGVSFNTFLILLYALIILIILVLLDIIYVSYSFSKKKFRFTWPLVILAQLVPLFVTILFLPITETLLSVVQCQTDQELGYQVMMNFPEIVCWRGWHLFHAGITLLFSSLFVFISSVVALALFQPRMATNKLTARQNSTGEVVFIMNKIICQLIFSFNPFSQNWVYSIILFALSGWLYWTYNMNDPFYNKKASKFFRILSTYYFWTNFMLLISQILSPLGFNGGLVVWISGLPFIGLIINFQHQSNINQLFSSNLKFKSGKELESHLVYVLQLIQNQDEDKNTYMLMTGYIEKHKQICVEDDCPFKTKKKKHKQISEKEDLTQKLLKQLERMYKLGIKKYPNCTRLRLSFAFFQIERLKNKNKAYEELTYAQKTDPTFEEEFIIYRFKKIIRENLENAGEENTTDLIQLIRFQNHISLCEEAMLQSGRLHKQFWTELKEETPDLKKLNQTGLYITKTVNKVRENYLQIAKINSSVPEVLYCYGIYLILVANEISEGKRIFQNAQKVYSDKINLTVKNKKTMQQIEGDEFKIETHDNPVLIVSAKRKTVGKIINSNLLFTELTGYSRKQIIQRNIEKILPDVLCLESIHQDKIEMWVEEKDNSEYQQYSTNSSYIGSIREGYLKDKLGFITPVEYKVFYSPIDEIFTASFKTISNDQKYCHLILDSHGIIQDTSYMGYLLFGLEKCLLEDNQCDIQQFLGIKKVDQLCKQHKEQQFEHMIIYQQQKYQSSLKIKSIKMKMLQKVDEDGTEHDHLLKQKMEDRCIGYYLIIMMKEKPNLTTNYLKRAAVISGNLSEKKIDEQPILSEENQQINHLYEDPDAMEILISNLANQKSTVEKPQFFQLKTKIKTMRLLNNQIKMVYDQSNNVEFERGDSNFNDDEEYAQIRLNNQNYHQKIRFAINTKLDHVEVGKLKVIGLIFIILIVALAGTLMAVFPLSFSVNSEKVSLLKNKSYEGNFLSKVILASLDPVINRTQILNELHQHKIVLESPLKLNLTMGNGQVIEKNLTDGISFFYSKLQQYFITGGNEDLHTLYNNYLNFVYPIMNQFYFKNNPNEFLAIILGVMCLVVSIVVLLLWIYISLKIDKKRIDILLWFLDIPISYITYLNQHCDSYLKNFLTIRETMSKGISLDESPPCLQEYVEQQGKQQEMEEQQKVRKTLIMKQRKKTLLSRIDCSYIKMLWIIGFGVLYPIICIYQIQNINVAFTFLEQQWAFSAQSVLWANSISLSQYFLAQNITQLGGTTIEGWKKQNQKHFFNSLQNHASLLAFNKQILGDQSKPEFTQISSIYNEVYFKDICELLNATDTNCGVLVESSLKGGYRVYQTFLNNHQNTTKEDLRQANQKYASEALLLMVKKWQEVLQQMINQGEQICEIIFYVFIFLGALGFFICWFLYLVKLNTEINEAIRMLNMIPFKLLSNARKQTQEFIIWIIKEANARKHKME